MSNLVKRYMNDEAGDINMEMIGVIALAVVGIILTVAYFTTNFNKVNNVGDKASSNITIDGVTYDGTLLD